MTAKAYFLLQRLVLFFFVRSLGFTSKQLAVNATTIFNSIEELVNGMRVGIPDNVIQVQLDGLFHCGETNSSTNCTTSDTQSESIAITQALYKFLEAVSIFSRNGFQFMLITDTVGQFR